MNDHEEPAGEVPPTGESVRRPRWMVWTFAIGALVAVAGYYRIMWGSVAAFVGAIDFCDKLFCDFVVYYYPMARQILVTKMPVIGFYYSPLFAVTLAPFGSLNLDSALWVWGILVVGTTAGLGILSYRTAPPESRVTIAGYIILFLTSFPILHNFKWGQVSVLLVLLVVASLVAYERQRVILSAVLLALAVSIKYYPAVFVLYFIIHRDWKFVISFIASVVIGVVVVPALILGFGETFQFWGKVFLESGEAQRAAGGPNSQYLRNVLVRTIPLGTGAMGPMRVAFAALGYFVVQLNVVLIFLLRKLPKHEGLTISFMLLFLSIPLFVATSWPHYLVYLPFCQVVAFEMLRQTYEPSAVRRRIMATLLIVSVVLASVMAFDLVGSWERYNGAGLPLWSDICLLVFTYLHAVPKIPPLRTLFLSSPAA